MNLFLRGMTLLSFLFFPYELLSATLDVCPTCAFTTIHDSIRHAAVFDTIQVFPGNYAEGVISIDKPLILLGVQHPIVDGRHEQHVFSVHADHVTIDGFVIQNSGQSDIEDDAGIRLENSHDCVIAHNTFLNTTYAIYLAKVDRCTIEENITKGTARSEVTGGNGLHAWYSQHLTVKHNRFEGQRDGIYLEFTTQSRIEGNVSRQNIRYGMHFMYSPFNQFYDNVFSENQTGVAVMYSQHIDMQHNRFEKSWGRASYGLLLKDIDDSLINRNLFLQNTVGIVLDGGNRNQFNENTFQHNGWAVNMLGNTEKNLFTRNNFMMNYFHVTTNSRSSLNTFASNYWDDYKGYDLNSDGTGDIPFRPMKTFSVWVSRYHELAALIGSPVIEFLEVAERVFPVLTPKGLADNTPRMKPVNAP